MEKFDKSYALWMFTLMPPKIMEVTTLNTIFFFSSKANKWNEEQIILWHIFSNKAQ